MSDLSDVEIYTAVNLVRASVFNDNLIRGLATLVLVNTTLLWQFPFFRKIRARIHSSSKETQHGKCREECR